MHDGKRNTATPLIYPYHHAPRAPLTGIVLSRALKVAYSTLNEAALVMSQTWNYPGTDARDAFYFDYIPVVMSTSFVPLCEGVRVLQGSHLVCRAQYLILGNEDAGRVHHRLVVTGNSITVTGDTLTEDISEYAAEGSRGQKITSIERANEDLYTGGFSSVSESVFDVELDPGQIGYACTVQVQTFYSNTGGSAAYPYYPCSVVVFQEAR